MPSTVLVVDDHPFILDGVTALLETVEDLEVVGTCADGEEAVEALEKYQPDLLVLDLQMQPKGGLEVLRQLPELSPGTRTILLTASIARDEVLEAVRLGARGLLLKEEAAEELLACIRGVLDGRRVIDARFLEDALEAAVQQHKEQEEAERNRDRLTPREEEVARLVATGLSNKKIARELDITEGTVKLHLHKIFQKVGVSNRVRLTLYMKENFPD